MAAPMTRAATNRRRTRLWLPMLVLGAVATLVGDPMIIVFNSLDLLGLMLMVAGLLGFAREVDK